jgi:hypothetical protein
LRPENRALLLEGRKILVPERILSHLEIREINRRQVVRDEDAPQVQVHEIHDGLAGADAARINRLGREPKEPETRLLERVEPRPHDDVRRHHRVEVKPLDPLLFDLDH